MSLLKKRLSDSRVKCAFIFGSIAEGKEQAQSDIDIVVIGDLGRRAVATLFSGLQEKTGREINPHVFSEIEFIERVKKKITFLQVF